MSRAVIYEAFGGPEVLRLREVAEPHAGPGEVRVRVTAAGLNPMDWLIPSRPEAAAQFGLTLPSGFGYDFAGVVDEAGEGAAGFARGDRVYGGALARAVADFVVIKASAEGAEALWQTPDGVSDEVAATLPVAGATAAAALALGVPPERISTVAAGPTPPGGVRATGGIEAEPDALSRITDAILAGQLTVPIAAVFPVGQVRDAVELQAGRHVHGKVVITL